MQKGIPTKTEKYPETPYVSVVIPVYNDGDRLKKCLRALGSQTYPEARYEVIVVDNGSDAPMPSVENYCQQARCIFYPHGGSYAARNRGVEESKGDIIAFTDADCVPSPAWIEQGVNIVSSCQGDVIVAGHIEIFFHDEKHPTACELHESVFGFNQKHFVERSHFGATANLFATRSTFTKIGNFDGLLMSGGDTEWGRRAWQAGVPLLYASCAVIRHPARRSITEIMNKLKRVAIGQNRLASKGGEYRKKAIIKLIKFLPSIRYRFFPVFRADHLSASEKLRVALLIPLLHYWEYWNRLISIDYWWRNADQSNHDINSETLRRKNVE